MGYNSTYRGYFTPSYLTKPRYKSPGDTSPLCEGFFTTVTLFVFGHKKGGSFATVLHGIFGHGNRGPQCHSQAPS